MLRKMTFNQTYWLTFTLFTFRISKILFVRYCVLTFLFSYNKLVSVKCLMRAIL